LKENTSFTINLGIAGFRNWFLGPYWPLINSIAETNKMSLLLNHRKLLRGELVIMSSGRPCVWYYSTHYHKSVLPN
jgi:hypothetical protein